MARGFSPPVTDGAWLPQILGKSPRPSGYIVRSSGPVSDWREPSVHLLINLQSLHSRINSGVDGGGPLCGTPRASSSNTITWFDGHVVRFVSAHRDSITATSPRLDNCRRVLYIQGRFWSSLRNSILGFQPTLLGCQTAGWNLGSPWPVLPLPRNLSRVPGMSGQRSAFLWQDSRWPVEA